MECTSEDLSTVVLLPSADDAGHELTCTGCGCRAAVRSGSPWVAQIRAFAEEHRH